MSATNEFGPHAGMQRPAIEAAQRVIHSLAENGPTAPLMDLAGQMPNRELREAYNVATEAVALGKRGFADVLGHALDTLPEGLIELVRPALITACEGVVESPGNLERATGFLHEYHRTRRRWEIGKSLVESAGDDKRCTKLVEELATLGSGAGAGSSLRAKAYALQFSPDNPPPPDEVCMVIGDIPIAARGGVTVIQGKSKVGKSAVIAAVLAACQRGSYQAAGDTFCIEWKGDDRGTILHMDTEQSPGDWHALVARSVTRSGMPEVSPRLVSLPLVQFARSERLTVLQEALEHEQAKHGRIAAVIIDGIADLCLSPNDEEESLETVSRIMALTHRFSCPAFAVLHENPGTAEHKTRGHLGSELNRKAFANLIIDKDVGSGVSTIFGNDMRKRCIPREQGFCFAWDDRAGMHLYQGRSAGLKAAQKEAAQIAREMDYFVPLFESIGTNGACPDSTADEILEAHRDIIGTENSPTRDSIKKRMQRAEILGVLRKTSRGTWSLNLTGQSGHERDK